MQFILAFKWLQQCFELRLRSCDIHQLVKLFKFKTPGSFGNWRALGVVSGVSDRGHHGCFIEWIPQTRSYELTWVVLSGSFRVYKNWSRGHPRSFVGPSRLVESLPEFVLVSYRLVLVKVVPGLNEIGGLAVKHIIVERWIEILLVPRHRLFFEIRLWVIVQGSRGVEGGGLSTGGAYLTMRFINVRKGVGSMAALQDALLDFR